MFKQVGPIARNLGRAALLLGCTTSVACSTSDVDRDATTDTSADREEPSDTSADRDATSDATSDASADASTADAGRDASGDGPACSNVAGSYFVDEMGTGRPRRTYCIRQYGCSATIAVDGSIANGVVAGNVLTVNNPAKRCEMTFSGRTAVERCTTFGGGTTSTYRTTLTARTLPGATSYCCDLSVATSCGAGQRCVPGNDATTSANLAFTACAAIDRWKARPVTMFPNDFDGADWVFPVLPPEHFAAIEALWRDTVIDEFALYLRRDDCDVLTTMRGSVRGAPVDFNWSYSGGDQGFGGSLCVTFGEHPGSRTVYGEEGFLEAARALAGDLPEVLMCAYLYLVGFDHMSPNDSQHTPRFWHDSELRELAVAWNGQHGVVPRFP